MKTEDKMMIQVCMIYLVLYLSAAGFYWILISVTSAAPEAALAFSLFVFAIVCPVAAYSYALGAVRTFSDTPSSRDSNGGVRRRNWGIVAVLSTSLAALGISFMWLVRSGEIAVSLAVLVVILLLSLALIRITRGAVL